MTVLDPLDALPARATPRVPAPSSVHGSSRGVVAGAAVVAVLARLPFLGVPAGADEAGYLQLAAQWHAGGGSLYGTYWVDRPPLLVTLFQLAAAAGGVLPLRVLGCLCAAAVVLLVARTAGEVGGPRAAAWSAALAAAMLVSPLLGALEVNGELLAAPFVAAGTSAAVSAARATSSRGQARWGAVAGAAGTCALLVKQNMLDVVVLGSVLLVAGVVTGATPRRAAARVVGSAALGAVGSLGLVAAWTLAHGTSLTGVAWAMYPFRLHAAQAVAAAGSQYASARLGSILLAALVGGAALLALGLLVATLRARLRDPVLLALTATVLFDVVSIGLGGGYWLHYLVELAVPLSIGGGLAAARAGTITPALARTAAVLAIVVSAGSLPVAAERGFPAPGRDVGAAIRTAAHRGDTLTTLYGEAQVNLAAGLPSPYPYLWSLPVKVLDPHLTTLDAVLLGARAPTWLVTPGGIGSWGLDADRTRAVVAARYHPVTTIDGQRVYLLDGVQRPAPRPASPALTASHAQHAPTPTRPTPTRPTPQEQP